MLLNITAYETAWDVLENSRAKCCALILATPGLSIQLAHIKQTKPKSSLGSLGMCWLTSHRSPERYLWSDRRISWGWCSWCWGTEARLWTAPSGKSCERSRGWTCPCCTCPEPRHRCLRWVKQESHSTVLHIKVIHILPFYSINCYIIRTV